MKTKMFSLYDSKAKMFGTPFFMPTIGMALRALQDLTNDNQSMVSRHPSDFSLYELGEFNDEDGSTQNKIPLNMVAIAAEFKQVKPKIQITDIQDVTTSENNKEKVEVK